MILTGVFPETGFSGLVDDMIAGSKGAPATVGFDVTGLLAGGVYLFDCPADNGGKSCLRTPLYLSRCQHGRFG